MLVLIYDYQSSSAINAGDGELTSAAQGVRQGHLGQQSFDDIPPRRPNLQLPWIAAAWQVYQQFGPRLTTKQLTIPRSRQLSTAAVVLTTICTVLLPSRNIKLYQLYA